MNYNCIIRTLTNEYGTDYGRALMVFPETEIREKTQLSHFVPQNAWGHFADELRGKGRSFERLVDISDDELSEMKNKGRQDLFDQIVVEEYSSIEEAIKAYFIED